MNKDNKLEQGIKSKEQGQKPINKKVDYLISNPLHPA
jgi:hypothetical protein